MNHSADDLVARVAWLRRSWLLDQRRCAGELNGEGLPELER
jgi:hypothetical protein